MKKIYCLSTLIGCGLILSACNHLPTHQIQQMSNPASQYCIDQGGKLRPLKDAFGNQSNNCKLPKGIEKDE